MNSAVKQLPRSFARTVGRWTSLLCVLLALPALGQGYSLNQPGTITINDAVFELGQNTPKPASPYPSSLVSSNLLGSLQKVAVTFNGLNHSYAADVDALLVREDLSTNIVLFSDVALNFPFSGISLTIDDTASAFLPASASVASGSYKATNLNGSDSDLFVSPAPGTAANTLGQLKGTSPNGTWKLFVMDDKASDVGSIGSWTLSLFTTPVFTTVPGSITNSEDSQFSATIKVNDSSTPLDQVKLSATSSDTNIVANESFAVSGTGTDRVLTFTPKSNQSGTITITLKLEDEISKGVDAITTTMTAVITPVNDLPSITLNTNAVTTLAGVVTTNTLFAVVSDIDVPSQTLSLFARSSNTNLVMDADVLFTAGTGGTNTFTIAPKGGATGTAVVAINVTDGVSTNSANITVTVNANRHVVFGNGTSIAVSDTGNAAPYPSTITVSNVVGKVGKVRVTLADVNTARPEDLDVLLVGPLGQKVVLMGQAGGGNAIAHGRLTFEDSAASAVPNESAIASGSYQPADYAATDLPSPAPAGPYDSALSTFVASNANGVWSLYVTDRTSGDGAEINSGWVLEIFQAPVIANLPATVRTGEDTNAVVNIVVTDADGFPTALPVVPPSGFVNVTVTDLVSSNNTITLSPLANVFGTNTISVIARDNEGYSSTNTFVLEVFSVNDSPTITPVAKQITYAGIPVQGIAFSVGDVETAAGSLSVSANSDNSSLLPSANIILGGSGASRTVSLYPVGTTAGTASVTLTVTDGSASSTATFLVEVLAPASPLYSNRSAIVINDSGTADVAAAASTYPSTITVPALKGKIQQVKVTLIGLSHPRPEDLDILLVGPTGKQLILLSDAGGTNAANNAQLLLDDSAADSLTATGVLVSGTFKPTNITAATADTFPGAPSPTSTTTTLNGFADTDAVGDWKLYVVDDNGNNTRGGTIAGGWMINFVTAPQLVDIANQTTTEDTTKRVAINIGDEQPGVPVTLSATSGNTNVVSNSGLTFEGTGANRTLVIVPNADKAGDTLITVTATINGAPSSDTFTLTVTPVDDAPIISEIANQTVPAGLIAGPISFTVTDKETSDSHDIPAPTVTSTDENVAPVSNIKVVRDVADGTGKTWLLTVTPNGVTTGSAAITITAKDPTNQKAQRTFTLNYSRNLAFANTGRIAIQDNSIANPYPSSIAVSGVNGVVSRATVTLRGLTHAFPDDVNVLLVAPDSSKKVVLLSNAGGGAPTNSISGVTLTFDDGGTSLVSGEEKLTDGTFKPANFGISTPNGSFPSGAPGKDYQSTMASFNGVSPNGQWQLYVFDDTFSDAGSIENGWILILETAPAIAPIGNQVTSEDRPLSLDFFISDADTEAQNLRTWATATSQAPSDLIASTNLVIAQTNTLQRTLTITPTPNLSGTNLIQVFVADNRTTNSVTFGLKVEAVDDPPVITTSTNRIVINEDTSTTLTFAISDVDSTLSITNASASTGNPTLINSTNLVIGGVATNVTLTVTPSANQNGEGVVTFSIKDATTTVSTNILFVINPVNDAPSISGLIASTNVNVGATLRDIPFTVGDIETSSRNLTVTATSSDQATIPNANIVLGGANENRLLSFTTIGSTTNTVTITITVRDEGNLTAAASVVVSVTAPPTGKLFTSSTPITIPAAGKGSVYPSTIAVSGLNGKIHKLSVTLEGFGHSAPDDVDVLLVSPTGQKIIILGDAGGRIAVTNARVVIDDSAANSVPDDGPLTAGAYRASNYSPDDSFPDIAGPYDNRLSDLVGLNPNGDWKLYVYDDTAGDSGILAQGWALNIITAPTITIGTPSITQQEDTDATGTITVADKDTPATTHSQLVVSVTSAQPTVQPADTITFATTSTNVSGILTEYVKNATIRPATNQPADSVRTTNTLTLTVTRTTDGATASGIITQVVTPVNDLQVISRITEKTTSENTPITITFLVTDVDTLARDLSITATNNGSSIVSMTGVKFYGGGSSVSSLPGNEVQLTLEPATGRTGSLPITVTVFDKNDSNNVATATFTLNVDAFNDAPTISTIADVTVDAGQTSAALPFAVFDQEGGTLRLTATSSDQGLVKNSSIVLNPVESTQTNRTVQVTSEIGVVGSSDITVTVSDGAKTATTIFHVRVAESRERTFANNRRIVINDNAGASDYPSIITVGGLVGDVSQVKVGLSGLAHGFPDDVDILLVSPGGQKVLLVSDAGGGTSITNVNLLLSDSAGSSIPDSGTIASGTFRPSNYDNASDPFASPAPAPGNSGYDTTLAAFNGSPANGDWKLYIVDDTASDSGYLTGGWSLYITTKPRISGLADVTVKEDQGFEVPFTLVEEDFVDPTFTFRTASDNAGLVRTNDLVISGSGTNWTIRGTPMANASGTNTITVFANNGRQEVSGTFKVIVQSINDTPTITDVPDQVIFAGTTTPPIEFNFGDVETETKQLTLDVQTDNSRLIPTNNVYITGSTLIVAPVGDLSGLANITLTVTDGLGLSASTTFAVRVLPSLNPQFANSAKITIRDNQSADLYPSTINVSGVSGNVARISVTLAEVNHVFPSDVDVLLVGPRGQKAIILSDAGGSGRLVNARLTFDDTATDAVPFNPSTPIASGTYKPSNYQGSDVFPAPAPAGPYDNNLASFVGTDPNGEWALYVLDDASPDAGTIVGGWILNIFTTNPTIGTIDDQVTDENVVLNVPVQIQDADTAATNLVTAVTTDNPRLLGVSLSGNGNTRTLTITPVEFANGDGNVTVSVTDGAGVAQTTFKVTVRPVDQAPLISGLNDINTPANRPAHEAFTVFDRETEAGSLVVGATISKPSLGSVAVSGTAGDRTLTFTPSGELGQGFVNVVVSDGTLSTTNIISVTVGEPYILNVSAVADQTMTENQTRTVPFTVTGSVSGAITVVGSSDNSGLVSAVNVGGSGSNFVATVVLVPNQIGTAKITLTASDDQLGVGSSTFNLTVQRGQRPPVIAPIAPQTTRPNIPAIVRLSITDEDTDIAQLVYTWATSDTNLVRNVVFGRAGDGAIIATVIVRANEGLATISITADDGANKATQAFPLTIIENPPVLASIDDQTTNANVPVKVTLGVTDSDTPLSELVFSSTTSNPGVIAGVTFDTSSGLAVATINPVKDATGVATVTISVRDSKTTVSRTFAVLITTALPPTVGTPSISLVGGVLTVTITWDGGGELEWASSAAGPWTSTGNSTGTFSEPASASARIYRVKR